jgi:hypothetical protein
MLLWNTNHEVYPLLDTVPGQMYPVLLRFNIVLASMFLSAKWSLFMGFPNQNFVCSSCLTLYADNSS